MALTATFYPNEISSFSPAGQACQSAHHWALYISALDHLMDKAVVVSTGDLLASSGVYWSDGGIRDSSKLE